jgi:hypothetical protein
MSKQPNILVLAAAAILLCPAVASATLFEMNHALPGASVADTRLPLRGGVASLHPTALIDRAGILQFPSLKSELAMSEDLLWIALGNAGTFGLRAVPREPDMIYSLIEAQGPVHQIARHATPVRTPATEGSAAEIWAAMLIGAGLILFQLRRNTRRRAIRFTNP